ncbi:MAG: asparagine synthase (glutamine-hydrolyzing) [Azospirillaceae bacterium]
MCGITALFAYGSAAPPVDDGEVIAMRDAMTSRGPDDAGAWRSEDGRVGLGHRRLAIIDLSAAGHQPMHTADGRLSIVFNGEIYNYRELRRELAQRGCAFRSDSDTEVLLHLYALEGAAMVSRLRGMFAFALWDADKRGLLLARDPFGIKPLYYADDGASLRVASQVSALAAGGRIDTRPDPAGHVGFFLWGYVPEPHTIYRGVRALPAGSTLWIDEAGARSPATYWSVTERIAEAEARAAEHPVDADTAHAMLRTALLDSVRHHMIADVPVGVFLSAGLDSATLAALAAECGGGVETFTLGFDEYIGRPEDEVGLAETTAESLGTRHRTRRVRAADFRAEFDALLGAMDQPSIDGPNTYFVAKAASEAGLKVALSGLGGDELFGTYPSYSQIPKLRRGLGPLAAVPGLGRGFRAVAGSTLARMTSPKYAGLLEYAGSDGDAYLLRRGLFMPWELPEVLDGEMVREGWAALDMRARLAATTGGLTTPHGRIMALETSWYMRNQLLRDADWASMAHSLELRVPLVDPTLFAALAPVLVGRSKPAKRDMALTPRFALPAEVLDRPKTGFMIPVREWIEPAVGTGERGLRGWARTVYELGTGRRAAAPDRDARPTPVAGAA